MKLGPLIIGYTDEIHTRTERIAYGLSRPVRFLYLSDLHLSSPRTSQRLRSRLIGIAAGEHPDAILLGGDLIDARSGLASLSELVRGLVPLAPVWATNGNHDDFFGADLVAEAVVAAGGNWLGHACAKIAAGAGAIWIDGSVSSKGSRDEPRVLCAHHPRMIESASRMRYLAVFAGHLHGGQCVFFDNGNDLYPGRFFSRWNGLRYRVRNTELIVSRGCNDTLPLRWNCAREAILCEII